jgi:NAD(P)H-hydrate epimerase
MNEALPYLPPRSPESHKGSFGLALVVGGSRGMAGAAALAGMAALRGGAGLVRLAVPEAIADTVAGFEPCYMVVPLPSDESGKIAAAAREAMVETARTATAVACGPGLGRSPALDDLVHFLYGKLDKPLVLDADGLNALANYQNNLPEPAAPRILTPHPGEFARLAGGERVPPERREAAAVALARHYRAVVVLKGHRTLVTDGQRWAYNSTGNPGMATGGSGDVLTGLIVALVCQSLAPFDAARLAVHLHGRAGDLAAAQLSQEAMIARDLLAYLPAAFREYRGSVSGNA